MDKDYKDDAPNCANPNGLHNEETNYPTIANINPKSYGKMECPRDHKYVIWSDGQSHSTNPARHQYASSSELKRMKLVK